MHLINIRTRKLEEFPEPPKYYAIFSHTWGLEEVSFQEYSSGTARHKDGYDKINKFCEKADADGWPYGWVDTCCIDKTSSAELSEAINSMYRWYQLSSVCFARLADVEHSLGDGEFLDSFRKSHWFSRGWTLQELLAPRHVTFLNQDWDDIGTKDMLAPVVEEITGIFSLARYEEASIAQIFSWAARRRTTRAEDRAYSLLGLVGVNMPLLYGEREDSFARLQAEIMARSQDDSIFAWSCDSVEPPYGYQDHPWYCSRLSTMLAASLDQFADCQDIYSHRSTNRPDTTDCSWAATNLGLSGTFVLSVNQEDITSTQILVKLSCTRDHGKKIYVMLDVSPTSNSSRNLIASPQSIKCLRTKGELIVGNPQGQPVSKTAVLQVLQPPKGTMPHRERAPDAMLRLDRQTFDRYGIFLEYRLSKGSQLVSVPSTTTSGAPICPGTQNTVLLSEVSSQIDDSHAHEQPLPIMFQNQELVDLRCHCFADYWNTGFPLEGREIHAFKLATGETFLLITYVDRYAKLLFMNLLARLDRIHECSQDFGAMVARFRHDRELESSVAPASALPPLSPAQQDSFYFLFMETRNRGARWTTEVSLEIRPGLWIEATNRPALCADGDTHGRTLKRITLRASESPRIHSNLMTNCYPSGVKRSFDIDNVNNDNDGVGDDSINVVSVESGLRSLSSSPYPSRRRRRLGYSQETTMMTRTTSQSSTAESLSQSSNTNSSDHHLAPPHRHLHRTGSGGNSSGNTSFNDLVTLDGRRVERRNTVVRQTSSSTNASSSQKRAWE